MMRIRLICIFVYLFIAGISFAQYSVSGFLIDENYDPIPGQIIQLLPSEKQVVSAEDGSFLFREINPATYTLVVKSDWWQSSKEITVDKNLTDIIFESELILPVEEVVIKSIRFGQENGTGQKTLNKKSIANQLTAADLPYMLRFTPSVVVTSDGGSGVGYTGMRIRGSDQSRINVTINGIPLNDAESQNVFFVDLPDLSASAQSIQIQRGVGTSSNGAASFGASVNVNTHDYTEEATATITGLIGSFNTKKTGLQFNTGKIGTGFYLSGRISQITSDGYIDRATSNLKSIALSPTIFFGKSSLRYDLLYGKERTYQAWYGIDPSVVETDRTFNPAGTERAGTPYEDQVDDYQQVHHQLHFNTALNDKINLGVSAHYTPGNGFYEEYKADQSRADYGFSPVITPNDTIDQTDLVRRRWLDNHFYGVVGSADFTLNEKSNLIIGGGCNHYKGQHFGEVIWAEFAQGIRSKDRYYDNQADKYDANVYAKYYRELNDNSSAYFDLQYRAIKYDFIGPDQNGNPINQSDELYFFNPKIGFNYRPTDRISIALQSGIAQKEPNRDDYTESSPLSRPKSEWLWDTEFGFTWDIGPRLQMRPNFYYMKYKDQLALTGQLNDVGAATRVNVEDSYRAGVEIDLAAKLSDKIELNANASFSENEMKSLTQFVDNYDAEFNYIDQQPIQLENTPLSFSPNQTAYLGLNYQVVKQSKISSNIYINAKHVGKQYIDLSGDQNNTLDAYQTVDAGIVIDVKNTFMKNMRIKFDVHNLFSQKYASNAWSYKYLFDGDVTYQQGLFPQALRHYNLTIALTF